MHQLLTERLTTSGNLSLGCLRSMLLSESITCLPVAGILGVKWRAVFLFLNTSRIIMSLRHPSQFMNSVVSSVLPREVIVGEIGHILGVDVDHESVEILTSVLADLLRSSRKHQYRTLGEVDALARTDARLYVIAAKAARAMDRENRALGRRCYLITSSTRFIRAADQAFRQPDEVSARPETLIGLLRLMGHSDVTAKEFVALFDNPLLQASVANSWSDVEDLLKAGISLRGKNQARPSMGSGGRSSSAYCGGYCQRGHCRWSRWRRGAP